MPTSTRKKLDGMTAVSEGSKVDILGFITWFSVPDVSVSLGKLRRTWIIAGLDPVSLPRDQRAVNVFKRAMREQEGRERQEDGTVIETTVTDVVESPEESVYQINQVLRDTNDKVVDFPKVLRVIFNKLHEELHYKSHGEVSRDQVMPLMERINAYYEANAKSITGGAVRALVRQFIKNTSDEQEGMVGLSGENLRGKAGGVYFVLGQYSDSLDALASCLEELYPDERAYLYKVPLADGASERELIRRHHLANTLDEIKGAIRDASELIRKNRQREIRSDVASHHWHKLQRLRRRAGEYNDALQDEQEEIQQMAEMLHSQLEALV